MAGLRGREPAKAAYVREVTAVWRDKGERVSDG
jgi:hypothetical protein